MSMTVGARLNVLFVDDDPLILQGLQRLLRPMRNEWSMAFVESGPKALERMESEAFHVVVSDMRMPGMNGAQLLTEIKNRYPRTVRLILSGHADKDLIMQCVGTAHQFLVKPSDPEAIRTAIARASAFDASAKAERVRKLVVEMESLPSVPTVYTEMVEKLKREDVSIDEIGSVVEKDPSITAKLLKLVNSAFFGLCREVASPSEAAAYLGIDTMKALVLGVNAFESMRAAQVRGFSMEQVWKHSLEAAGIARRIVERENTPRIYLDESFVAGMLHDLGKVVLAVNSPMEYELVLGRAEEEQRPVYMVEEEVLGANHADVAGYILNLWGLPARVVEAITHHHDPQISVATGLNPTIAVHVANAVAHAKNNAKGADGLLQSEYLRSIGVSGELKDWMEFAI
jgi:HD-like signal output (HDOD) protein/CheY-like chemotaxis protein